MAKSKAMERAAALFVEGMGAAFATSGVLSQLQGRIFGLVYLEPRPLSLDEIADALQQSKSNISITIRGLVDWHLVHRVSVPGSRRDHYEAATDFWRVMMEIMERRFRWNLRQVIAAVDETRKTAAEGSATREAEWRFVGQRLDALKQFAAGVDGAIEAFGQGQAVAPDVMRGGPVRRKKR
jgi:HTH-type transcriptional regulator, glycine betaine synthesis regulator